MSTVAKSDSGFKDIESGVGDVDSSLSARLLETGLNLGFKDIESGVGNAVDSSFSARLLEWGNSRTVQMFWAFLGCICSFFCPMFLYSGGRRAVGDVGPIRLTMMLISCVIAAALYRVGFALRHHRLIRGKPSMVGLMMGNIICCFIYIALGVTFLEDDTWPTVVGLELFAVSVFVLLEMVRPAVDFFMLRFFVCLPIVVGGYHHGWDFIHYGWPTIVVAAIFLLWRVFFHEHHGAPF